MELFSTQAYEDVRIDELADRAGISRGLMYHYFPTKKDFYVAVSRAAADEIREVTEPDPALPPAERVRAAVDAYLQKALDRSHGFLTAYRGSIAGDPDVRAIVEEARELQARRILAAFVPTGHPPDILWLAARGWIALVQDVTALWLHEQRPGRAQVRDMLVGALEGALAGSGLDR